MCARSGFPALQNTKVSFGICGKPLVTKKVLLGECGVLFCSIFFSPLHRGQKQPLYADSQISVRTRWRAHSAQTRSHQDDCVGLQVLANSCERAIDRRTRWARMEAAVKQAWQCSMLRRWSPGRQMRSCTGRRRTFKLGFPFELGPAQEGKREPACATSPL